MLKKKKQTVHNYPAVCGGKVNLFFTSNVCCLDSVKHVKHIDVFFWLVASNMFIFHNIWDNHPH